MLRGQREFRTPITVQNVIAEALRQQSLMEYAFLYAWYIDLLQALSEIVVTAMQHLQYLCDRELSIVINDRKVRCDADKCIFCLNRNSQQEIVTTLKLLQLLDLTFTI